MCSLSSNHCTSNLPFQTATSLPFKLLDVLSALLFGEPPPHLFALFLRRHQVVVP
jgi:hypothetical protein